jgi:hypothetical protein
MYSRLTDRKAAQELKDNVEGLRRAGIEPKKSDLIYIKLAEIEDLKELELAYLRRREEQMKADGRLPERGE